MIISWRLTEYHMNLHTATPADVEALKQKWLNNPSFDLGSLASAEVGERFAPYQKELKTFQEKTELAWAQVSATQQHVLHDQPVGFKKTSTEDISYQHVIAREALERYLYIVTPQLPELVREDLGDFITLLIETAIRFTLIEHQKKTAESEGYSVSHDNK